VPVSMPLSDLLRNIFPNGLESINIGDITQDSRLVREGSLFFAVPGLQQDGRIFIQDAISQKASAILYENSDGFHPGDPLKSKRTPLLGVAQLNNYIGLIASRFYQNPSHQMTIIGVTGTNGKTSITQFITQILNRLGQTCAVMGTLGDGFPPDLKITGFTTPDAIYLQKELAGCLSQGAQTMAMEVSSVSLVQQRVTGTEFDIAVFTNLTREHLNYHKTMEEYGAAKARLFQFPSLKTCIYNVDDDFGLELLSHCPRFAQALVYSTDPHLKIRCPAVIATEISHNSQGFHIQVNTPWGKGAINSTLIGQFNVSNLLAVLCVLGSLNIPLTEICPLLEQVKPPPGRMQTFGGTDGKPLAIVDYAHTPDALRRVLLSLREFKPRKIWCVFGCSGGRDHGKRPQMGTIAEAHADYCILTTSNSRNEKPSDIIEEIKAGMISPHLAHIELDRDTAIAHAINNAASEDIILISGKGHETVQIIGETAVPQSDIKTVQHLLES
jgi:UDP-N-acetylmuramoyl-L-alanyl-D-glutamate--2,6-diaminopimelate ligase